MKKVVVAGVSGGVGQTTTVINLAAAAATAGCKVLLLDADPRGSVRAALRLLGSPKPADASAHGAIWRDVRPGLDVATPFTLQRYDHELLVDLIAEWKNNNAAISRYDVVIIHAPGIEQHGFADVVSFADELILVLRPEPLTTRLLPLALDAVQGLATSKKLKFSGFVVNHPTPNSQEDGWVKQLGQLHSSHTPVFFIPFEPAQEDAELLGRSLVEAAPGSKGGQAFMHTAVKLGLQRGKIAEPLAARLSTKLEASTSSSVRPVQNEKQLQHNSMLVQLLLMLVSLATGFGLFWLLVRS